MRGEVVGGGKADLARADEDEVGGVWCCELLRRIEVRDCDIPVVQVFYFLFYFVDEEDLPVSLIHARPRQISSAVSHYPAGSLPKSRSHPLVSILWLRPVERVRRSCRPGACAPRRPPASAARVRPRSPVASR